MYGPPSTPGEGVTLPRLGPLGAARFAWRQLTSMRTALLLLLLLAIAAVPGSVFPQNRINPGAVQSYLLDHTTTGPLLQRIGAFDVYSSVWFSAIYLLLFVSLVGCVLPRSRQHAKAVRAGPPITPRRFERLAEHRRAETATEPGVVLDDAREYLRRKRFRTTRRQDGAGPSVAAERGYLAETGNLVFHLALLGLLISIAAGSFLAYSGQKIVVAGNSFSNTLTAYNTFSPGRLVDESDLAPFSFTLQSLAVRFEEQAGGNQFGAARDFAARVAYRDSPTSPVRQRTIRVNDPLEVDGAKVFLVGNGYAPVITIRDGAGDVVQNSAVPFLPSDGNYTSNGVVKAPDARPRQLGLMGVFLPTARTTDRGVVSVFPDARLPRLIFTAYTGDLGMDTGVPQNVYGLDETKLKQVTVGKQPWSAILAPGQQVGLPGGLGTVRFDGVRRFAAFDVRHDPTKDWVLLTSVLALAGLTTSLFVPRRRVWVRALPGDGGRTVVEVAGLSRRDGDTGLAGEVDAVLAQLVKESR